MLCFTKYLTEYDFMLGFGYAFDESAASYRCTGGD